MCPGALPSWNIMILLTNSLGRDVIGQRWAEKWERVEPRDFLSRLPGQSGLPILDSAQTEGEPG